MDQKTKKKQFAEILEVRARGLVAFHELPSDNNRGTEDSGSCLAVPVTLDSGVMGTSSNLLLFLRVRA